MSMQSDATEIIADATRRALDELDTFADDAQLRAAMIVLDVGVPDPEHPDDPAEAYTHTLWKVAPISVGTSHAYGIAATAAHAMLTNGEAAE